MPNFSTKNCLSSFKAYGKALGKEVLHGTADTMACSTLASLNLVKAGSMYNSTYESTENKLKNDWKNTGYFAGMTLFSIARVVASPITAIVTKNQDYSQNLPVFMEMSKQHSQYNNEYKIWYVPYLNPIK